jgi:hypothetical protein
MKYLILHGTRTFGGAFFQLTNSARPLRDSGASTPLGESSLSSRIVLEDRAVDWSGRSVPIGWKPMALPRQQSLLVQQFSVDWLQTAGDRIEFAGISAPGVINWSEVTDPDCENATPPRSLAFGDREEFRSVLIWQPGRVVGITAGNCIYWLRADGARLQEWAPRTTIPFPTTPIAIFPSYATEEVIVILTDGELVRVPIRL